MPINSNYQQPIPQGGVYFDFVSSGQAAQNYLVSPGNTVYLFDSQNRMFYEKTFNTFQAFDLVPHVTQVQPTEQVTNQNDSNNLTRDDILQLIREELRQYNPHIPKKDRRTQ